MKGLAPSTSKSATHRARPEAAETRHDLTMPSALELEAKALIARRSSAEEPVLQAIEREIETVLEHLDEMRSIQTDLEKDISRTECRVGTDLLRFGARPYIISTENPNHSFNESQRQSLKRRLDDLAKERRSISMDLHGRRRLHLDRLAGLIERHRQVRGPPRGV